MKIEVVIPKVIQLYHEDQIEDFNSVLFQLNISLNIDILNLNDYFPKEQVRSIENIMKRQVDDENAGILCLVYPAQWPSKKVISECIMEYISEVE